MHEITLQQLYKHIPKPLIQWTSNDICTWLSLNKVDIDEGRVHNLGIDGKKLKIMTPNQWIRDYEMSQFIARQIVEWVEDQAGEFEQIVRNGGRGDGDEHDGGFSGGLGNQDQCADDQFRQNKQICKISPNKKDNSQNSPIDKQNSLAYSQNIQFYQLPSFQRKIKSYECLKDEPQQQISQLSYFDNDKNKIKNKSQSVSQQLSKSQLISDSQIRESQIQSWSSVRKGSQNSITQSKSQLKSCNNNNKFKVQMRNQKDKECNQITQRIEKSKKDKDKDKNISLKNEQQQKQISRQKQLEQRINVFSKWQRKKKEDKKLLNELQLKNKNREYNPKLYNYININSQPNTQKQKQKQKQKQRPKQPQKRIFTSQQFPHKICSPNHYALHQNPSTISVSVSVPSNINIKPQSNKVPTRQKCLSPQPPSSLNFIHNAQRNNVDQVGKIPIEHPSVKFATSQFIPYIEQKDKPKQKQKQKPQQKPQRQPQSQLQPQHHSKSPTPPSKPPISLPIPPISISPSTANYLFQKKLSLIGISQQFNYEINGHAKIGRVSCNEILLQHNSVSREHAEIVPEFDMNGHVRYYLKDIASRFGTYCQMTGIREVRLTCYLIADVQFQILSFQLSKTPVIPTMMPQGPRKTVQTFDIKIRIQGQKVYQYTNKSVLTIGKYPTNDIKIQNFKQGIVKILLKQKQKKLYIQACSCKIYQKMRQHQLWDIWSNLNFTNTYNNNNNNNNSNNSNSNSNSNTVGKIGVVFGGCYAQFVGTVLCRLCGKDCGGTCVKIK